MAIRDTTLGLNVNPSMSELKYYQATGTTISQAVTAFEAWKTSNPSKLLINVISLITQGSGSQVTILIFYID